MRPYKIILGGTKIKKNPVIFLDQKEANKNYIIFLNFIVIIFYYIGLPNLKEAIALVDPLADDHNKGILFITSSN